jgi:hypothetical protein
MRNYFYMSKERIENIYNQLVTRTPMEEIRVKLDRKGILTDWKSRIEAGFVALIKGGVEGSLKKTEERTFEEKVTLSVALEQKIDFIESKINFTSIDDLIKQKESLEGKAVSFRGAYFSKGLKAPQYYSAKWDGTLPFLYKKVQEKEIKIVYNPLHFLSNTPWAVVHGKLRIDGIGFVANFDDREIIITPIAFGSPISSFFLG